MHAYIVIGAVCWGNLDTPVKTVVSADYFYPLTESAWLASAASPKGLVSMLTWRPWT